MNGVVVESTHAVRVRVLDTRASKSESESSISRVQDRVLDTWAEAESRVPM